MRFYSVPFTLALTFCVGCRTDSIGPNKAFPPPKLVSPDPYSELKVRLTGHKSPVLAVTFSSNGRFLASADSDETVRVWDVATAKSVAEFAGGPRQVVEIGLLSEGRLLAALFHWKLKVWDVKTREELEVPLPARIARMAASPTKPLLALQTFESKPDIILWDLEKRTTTATLIAEGVSGHSRHVKFSPDGKYLAADYDIATNMIVWDTLTGKIVSRFANSDDDPPFAFVPDRRQLAFSTGGLVRFYEIEERKDKLPILDISVSYGGKQSMAFSPDGDILAIGFNSGNAQKDRYVRLFDTRAKWVTSNLIAELEGHEQGVNAVAFSPTGEYLASGSQDGSVILWGKKKSQ